MSDTETIDLEVVQPTAIEAMERAQVDIQIATARKYGRTIAAVKTRMMEFATLDEETAASCFYTLPARKGGDGKPLYGPSVRLAEIALASYHHMKAGSRIISDDGKFITAQAVVHDLFNNVSVSIEVKRRVTDKNGRRYSDDMIATTGNAATSIALRNAVFRVVPRTLINSVYDAARQVAVGDVKSLVTKRAKIIDRLGKMGVTLDRVLAVLGVSKLDDVGLDKMEILIGLGTSIKDGELSLEDAFPLPGAKQEEPVKEAGPVFKKAPAPAPEPKPEPAPEAAQEQPWNGEHKPTEPLTLVPDSDPTKLDENQSALQEIVVTECKADWDTFKRAVVATNWFPKAPEWQEFLDVPSDVAKRLIGAKRGLIQNIEKAKTA
jgi:hypothetical protein